jgi:hypothetical protein
LWAFIRACFSWLPLRERVKPRNSRAHDGRFARRRFEVIEPFAKFGK